MSVKASVKTAQDVRLREEEDGGEVFEQRQSRRKGCAGRVVADHYSVGYFVDFDLGSGNLFFPILFSAKYLIDVRVGIKGGWCDCMC